ncbi:MAG: hypothetical protein IKW85_13235 [Muribaculaceae bacterium]|nr:hypothetical protein [Muribaculaceae bacterium]
MTSEKRTSIANVLVIIGLLLMLVMAILPLINSQFERAEWVIWTYTAGALAVLAARLIGYDNSGSLRFKRLQHILILSALLYCASGSVKFIEGMQKNWLALLFAGLVVQLYATWMIDREVKKNEK